MAAAVLSPSCGEFVTQQETATATLTGYSQAASSGGAAGDTAPWQPRLARVHRGERVPGSAAWQAPDAPTSRLFPGAHGAPTRVLSRTQPSGQHCGSRAPAPREHR